MRLFTYGVLKDPKKLEKDGATDIVENAYVKGFKMYIFRDAFPVTKWTENTDDIIYGTLCIVPYKIVRKKYDPLEGYEPWRMYGQNMYIRSQVPVYVYGECVPAQMYVTNEEWFTDVYKDENLISSGNFDDRKEG